MIEGFDGRRAVEFLAVDEEGRRRIDAEPLRRGQPALRHLVFELLVADAGLELFLADAAKPGDLLQRGAVIARRDPLLLLREKGVDQRIEPVGRGAAGTRCTVSLSRSPLGGGAGDTAEGALAAGPG